MLVVKYGYITLIKTKADLCESMKNVDIACPLEEGRLTLTKTVDLPKEIPPVSALAFTPESSEREQQNR